MAKKKTISVKSVFYTAVSLVWIFGLAAIAHIVMVLIEKHNPVIKYDYARACAIIGFLTIGARNDDRPFDADDRLFLRQIAAQAAVCINSGQLHLKRQKEKEELDRTLYNLSLLYSIGRAMTYISDLKSLLQYILSQAIEITSA